MYLVPYGQTLNFMASYKGMVKMAEKYSQRKIRSIYAKLVRDGDGFEETIENGEPTVKFSPVPFSNAEIIGAFAVCNFADGGSLVETMSKAEIEPCRKKSRASNSPAWSQFWGEMAKKTVINRACKIFVNTSTDADPLADAYNRTTANDYIGDEFVDAEAEELNENAFDAIMAEDEQEADSAEIERSELEFEPVEGMADAEEVLGS